MFKNLFFKKYNGTYIYFTMLASLYTHIQVTMTFYIIIQQFNKQLCYFLIRWG